MKNVELKLDTKKLDKLIDGIKKDTYKVKVGVIGAMAKQKDSKTGMTVAGYGMVNEFGSVKRSIPERSFIRQPLNHHLKEEIQANKEMFGDLLFKKQAITTAYEKLGVIAQNIIKESFLNKGDGSWGPNSEITINGLQVKNKEGKVVFEIKGKGVNNPLIDTGRLSKSIDYELVKQ